MKRPSDDHDDDDGSVSDTEELVDVDDEQKEELMGSEDMMDEEEDEEGTSSTNNVAFLDTFYGLSSSDPVERAQAARDLLHHCLTGPNANIKDAAYALKRLLNALCSGRACARQGNASALVSFLRITCLQEPTLITQIQQERGVDVTSGVRFIREQLLSATYTDGKGKASEERDAKFGRLFGILAIIKSGILLATTNGNDAVVYDLCNDLIELYKYRLWLREPVAHAICLLLLNLYKSSNSFVEVLVHEVIVPNLFGSDDESESAGSIPPIANLTPEQLAVVLVIQTHHEAGRLPTPFNSTAALSNEIIPHIAVPLSETSSVKQPRTHLIWDAIWHYITIPAASQPEDTLSTLEIRSSTPVGKESVQDILEAIMKHVVIERLLGQGSGNKATHERRALALNILSNLLGLEFVSSLTGRTMLLVGSQIIESVALQPVVVRKLIIDLIGTTNNQQRGQAEHLLKPMALHILESVTKLATANSSNVPLRKAILYSLLRSEPRFDSRTKTSTVDLLIGERFDGSFWRDFVLFLEEQILKTTEQETVDDNTDITVHKAIGYIDLLLHMGKRLVKLSSSEPVPKESGDSAPHGLLNGILNFFLLSAFYDCRSLKGPLTPQSKSKKKKKEKTSSSREALLPVIQIAFRAKQIRPESCLPQQVRNIISSRFFSLLSELIMASFRNVKDDKDVLVLSRLDQIVSSCIALEEAGCSRGYGKCSEVDTDEAVSPALIVEALQRQASECNGHDRYMKEFACSFASLGNLVYLYSLSCHVPSNEHDDPDDDDDEEAEETIAILSDMHEILPVFSPERSITRESFQSIAELCTNILSSPLGRSEKNVTCSKVLRELVRIVWIRVLYLAAKQKDFRLVPDAANVVLQAIGIDTTEENQVDIENESSNDVDGDVEGSDADINDGDKIEKAFEKSNMEWENDRDSDLPESESTSSNDDDPEIEDDITIDATRLHSMLEQDVDEDSVEETDLEHHEGADAALAKLIKLKQEARKTSLKMRERLELARRVRCMILLETLLSGKPEGWGVILTVDMILRIMVSLIRYRKGIERAVYKIGEKSPDTSLNDKKCLLERITGILKTKLLKMRISSFAWDESIDRDDFVTEATITLLSMSSQGETKDQQELCSAALLLMFRSITDQSAKVNLADCLLKSMHEWGQKKKVNVGSNFLDHLIRQAPVLAKASLILPMAEASSNARSSFLKSEAFRILGSLLTRTVPGNAADCDLEEIATKRVLDASETVLKAVSFAVQDSEMKKTKRVRDVLKALLKLLSLLSSVPGVVPSQYEHELNLVGTLVEDFCAETDSGSLKNICETVRQNLSDFLNKRSAMPTPDGPNMELNDKRESTIEPLIVVGDEDEEKEEALLHTNLNPSQINKKKSKKKKKKDRR